MKKMCRIGKFEHILKFCIEPSLMRKNNSIFFDIHFNFSKTFFTFFESRNNDILHLTPIYKYFKVTFISQFCRNVDNLSVKTLSFYLFKIQK